MTSCGKTEFMNMYSFTENYSRTSNSNLSLSDFYFQSPGADVCTAVLGDEGDEVLLSLKIDVDQIINKVTISLIKQADKPTKSEQLDLFRKTLSNTLQAFCNYDNDYINDILSAFSLKKDKTFTQTGELTLKKDNFYFVYYSTDIICQLMIYNTYLQKIEPTQKPVSKPYYAEDFIIKETP